VRIFEAVRPEAADGFPSIGARGCFFSHLGILREAVATGQDQILICEDDLDFSPNCLAQLPSLVASLKTADWSIFYGGYGDPPLGTAIAPDLQRLNSYHGVSCSHFYAIRGRAIADLKDYLEAMLLRPSGDPQGGPMHYDGALSWFRKDHPHHITLAAAPPIGVQRSSRTDIHALRWFDRWPIVRSLASLLRRTRTRWVRK
jgi:hypothetical protein